MPRPELLVIRPPSESLSVHLRVTRGCKWNRCRFCGIYPSLGEHDFSIRTLGDIKVDIDLLRRRISRVRSVFIGDSDPLEMPLRPFLEVLNCIRESFPEQERITCYARATTIWKKKKEGIAELKKAGLNRMHIGLESGDIQTLRFHKKGQSPRVLIETGKWLKEAGIEISYYVLLGLGGKERWQEHIDKTAEVLNAINPEFIRIRRLWIYKKGEQGAQKECPLWNEIRENKFTPQTPEGTVVELQRLIGKLNGITSVFTCDHANNYLALSGSFPEEKQRLLDEITEFISLPKDRKKEVYADTGSRI